MTIQKNTFKMSCILILSLIMLVACLIAINKPEKYVFILLPSIYLVVILSITGIFAMAYCIYFFTSLLFSKKAFFAVNEKGIYNGLGWLNQNMIKWDDIKQIDTIQYQGIWRIRIIVKNTELYLKSLNFITNFIAKKTIEELQTPILIDNIYLNCNFEELKSLIFKYWNDHNKTRS